MRKSFRPAVTKALFTELFDTSGSILVALLDSGIVRVDSHDCPREIIRRVHRRRCAGADDHVGVSMEMELCD